MAPAGVNVMKLFGGNPDIRQALFSKQPHPFDLICKIIIQIDIILPNYTFKWFISPKKYYYCCFHPFRTLYFLDFLRKDIFNIGYWTRSYKGIYSLNLRYAKIGATLLVAWSHVTILTQSECCNFCVV